MRLCTNCNKRPATGWCKPCNAKQSRQRRRAERLAEPATWENARYGDGPEIIRWLEARQALDWTSHEDEEFVRRMSRWRAGGYPNYYGVDEVLVRLGYHVIQLPPECWLHLRPANAERDRKARTAERRAQRKAQLDGAVQAYVADEGSVAKHVAKEHGITASVLYVELKERGVWRPRKFVGQKKGGWVPA